MNLGLLVLGSFNVVVDDVDKTLKIKFLGKDFAAFDPPFEIT